MARKNEDMFEELNKIYGWLYSNKEEHDVQKILDSYSPKSSKEKRSYKQEWPIYEKACSQEKLMFFQILKDAVDHMNITYEYRGNGRPPSYYADILKCLCIKSYNNYSSWRAESELKIARAMGIIGFIPKRSTLNKYMQNKKITEMLHQLYKIIAEPLSLVEIYFAADATGISQAYGNKRWMQVRHTPEEEKKRKEYRKLHIISGCNTNIICSAKITDGNKHESPFFKPLLDDTAKIFNVKEISADAGFISKDNVKAATNVGAIPFIMPKKNMNVTTKGPLTPWNVMLRLWKHYQMVFAQHYHRRSNVESTFGAFKRKFGDFCRCKKPGSQENEILCRIVCFNSGILSEALLSYDLRKGFLK